MKEEYRDKYLTEAHCKKIGSRVDLSGQSEVGDPRENEYEPMILGPSAGMVFIRSRQARRWTLGLLALCAGLAVSTVLRTRA